MKQLIVGEHRLEIDVGAEWNTGTVSAFERLSPRPGNVLTSCQNPAIS